MVILELEIKNDLQELARMGAEIESFGEKNSLQNEAVFDINLVLDELVTNIISYGYEDENVHIIKIVLEKKPDKVSITLSDDAKAFNPLGKDNPDTSIPLEEKPIGGLGIYFVKQKMKNLVYSRKSGRNILKMDKMIN